MTEESASASWESRYKERGRIWSGNPNGSLVAAVAGSRPRCVKLRDALAVAIERGSSGRARFTDEDYASILTFRTRLRQFLAWSAAQAKAAGLTPAQHQLLLAVRGHPEAAGPTIGQIAGYLQLRHHSAVGLVDRAEAAGLVRRVVDPDDRRVARVQLEPAGAAALEELTALHIAELQALAAAAPLPRLTTTGRDQADHKDPDARAKRHQAEAATMRDG